METCGPRFKVKLSVDGLGLRRVWGCDESCEKPEAPLPAGRNYAREL